MLFFKKKLHINENEINNRIFEFIGAIDTNDLEKINFSFNVLTSDLHENIEKFESYHDFQNYFNTKLIRRGGPPRYTLCQFLKVILLEVPITTKTQLNSSIKIPFGFSCPNGTDLERKDFNFFWNYSENLISNLDENEILFRKEKFVDILSKDDCDDELTKILWHDHFLTNDLVDVKRTTRHLVDYIGKTDQIQKTQMKIQDEFSNFVLLYKGSKNFHKSEIIEKFVQLIKILPVNHFIFSTKLLNPE